MSNQQRDAVGIVVFDDAVQNFVPPSARHGNFMRVLHAIEKAQPGTRTDFEKPFYHCMSFLHRRGMLVVISDFYAEPDRVVKAMVPLRAHGDELILFHLLDPQEIRPVLRDSALMVDMESGEDIEVTPEYLKTEYRLKIDGHIAEMKSKAQGAGIDYFMIDTSQPLDEALRDYLLVRQGRK